MTNINRNRCTNIHFIFWVTKISFIQCQNQFDVGNIFQCEIGLMKKKGKSLNSLTPHWKIHIRYITKQECTFICKISMSFKSDYHVHLTKEDKLSNSHKSLVGITF